MCWPLQNTAPFNSCHFFLWCVIKTWMWKKAPDFRGGHRGRRGLRVIQQFGVPKKIQTCHGISWDDRMTKMMTMAQVFKDVQSSGVQRRVLRSSSWLELHLECLLKLMHNRMGAPVFELSWCHDNSTYNWRAPSFRVIFGHMNSYLCPIQSILRLQFKFCWPIKFQFNWNSGEEKKHRHSWRVCHHHSPSQYEATTNPIWWRFWFHWCHILKRFMMWSPRRLARLARLAKSFFFCFGYLLSESISSILRLTFLIFSFSWCGLGLLWLFLLITLRFGCHSVPWYYIPFQKPWLSIGIGSVHISSISVHPHIQSIISTMNPNRIPSYSYQNAINIRLDSHSCSS